MSVKVSVIIPVYNAGKYLARMLNSVKAQSFRDFEILLVDDGSDDNSRDIMKDFALRDKRCRCFYPAHGGVSSARNLGIAEARGDYLVFYDADDYIPPKALEQMYRASNGEADLVVGIMESVTLGQPTLRDSTRKLARKKKIDKRDTSFIWSWSLCNKMFKRSVVMKNRLAMAPLAHGEDGVFLYAFLNHAQKICGCNHIAYTYYRRPFWQGSSASQTGSRHHFSEILEAHVRIEKNAVKLMEGASAKEAAAYRQELFARFFEVGLVGEYYRVIWKNEEGLEEDIFAAADKYGAQLKDPWRKKLTNRNGDIALFPKLATKEELAGYPRVTVVLSGDYTTEQAGVMLGSLYNQTMPAFEVFVPQKYKEAVPEFFLSCANLHLVPWESQDSKRLAMEESKGEYILFADEPLIFTEDTLRQMEKVLHQKKDLAFAAALVKRFDGEEYHDLSYVNAGFGFSGKSQKKRGKLYGGDIFLGNKLLRKTMCPAEILTMEGATASRHLYQQCPFQRIRSGCLLTQWTDLDIQRLGGRMPSKAVAAWHSSKNKKIEGAIRFAKKKSIKQRVKRLIRKG